MLLDAYRLARPFLFLLDGERAHGLTFTAGRLYQALPGSLALLGALAGGSATAAPVALAGLNFPNRLGLAAGLDKEAELLPLWKALGFGHVEVGTVTPRPQPGNPRPRLFRLVDEGMILNRMGFNSSGAESVARRLRQRPRDLVVGANLGKNKTTPEPEALEDYRAAYRLLSPLVDYVALNVSSPNTPGLRNLQAPEALKPLLEGMMSVRKEMGLESQPIFLKLAPDLAPEDLDAIVDVVLASGISGLIATNTTIDREILPEAWRSRVEAWGPGGLSGPRLYPKARQVRQRILARLGGRLPFIACGGIGTASEAREALTDGSDLIQIYTTLIFQGPAAVPRLREALDR